MVTQLSTSSIKSLPHITAEILNNLPLQQQIEARHYIEIITHDWDLIARDKQKLPPGDWTYWLIRAGRGFGKTRTGVEIVRKWKDNYPLINLVGATASDVRDIMVEGESGIMSVSPYYDKPNYEPSKKKLTWPNGAVAKLFSADEPDRLRGPQCYKAWADELAAWRYEEAWVQLKMGLRLGDNPQCIITTTPRPSKIIKELDKDPNTKVTRGTSYENRDNLADAFYDQIIKMYEGTRIGRQELNAEILEDVEGALWSTGLIEKYRVNELPIIKKAIVAVDPAVSDNKDSDEVGIVVVGLGENNHGYVFDDLSGIMSPNQWAEKTVYAYNLHDCVDIVAEVNQGGDLVKMNIQTVSKNVPVTPVRAYKGKYLRAEPVASLYEQGRVHHVGSLSKLEDEMTTWDASTGQKSPNRLDALVYGLTYLMLEEHSLIFFG